MFPLQKIVPWGPFGGHLQDKKSISRSGKQKYPFKQIQICVIPHFHVILTGQSISCTISMVKVKTSISKSSGQKYHFLTNKARNMCNICFYVILTGQCLPEIILVNKGHLQGRKVNFIVEVKGRKYYF